MKNWKPKLTANMAIISLFFLLAGCSKSVINIYDEDETDGITGHPGKGNALVTFNASVENRNVTRAITLMKSGIKSQVYAYLAVSTPTGTEQLYTQGSYITASPGMLMGADNYKMYLPNNTYNFCAVSENSPSFPPMFSNGESEPLSNGIDYLWWRSWQQDVISTQIHIPITFQHVATQVVIEVEAGEGVELNELLSATITPSLSGATMKLTTGTIEPATSYDLPENMGINGFKAQYIMLPLQTTIPMEATLKVMINGEADARTYQTEIKVPNGALKAGDSYVFMAIIEGNRVSFPLVTIKDWTEVDETGNPLYPMEK